VRYGYRKPETDVADLQEQVKNMEKLLGAEPETEHIKE
jgi:hypothetical protein